MKDNLQEAINILNNEYIHRFITYAEGDPLEITQERLHIQIGWIEAMRTLAECQEERKRQNIGINQHQTTTYTPDKV